MWLPVFTEGICWLGNATLSFTLIVSLISHRFEPYIVFWRVHYPGQAFCYTQVPLISLLCGSQLFHLLGFSVSLLLDDSLQHDKRIDHDSSSYPKAKLEWSQSGGQCTSLLTWSLLSTPGHSHGNSWWDNRARSGWSHGRNIFCLILGIWALMVKWKCLAIPEWSRHSWMLAYISHLLAHCSPLLLEYSSPSCRTPGETGIVLTILWAQLSHHGGGKPPTAQSMNLQKQVLIQSQQCKSPLLARSPGSI